MNKIALLFPGQGSQYIGMGKDLLIQYPIARQTFEEANDILGFDLRKLCIEGSTNELSETVNAQPAILVTSIAMFRVYNQKSGIIPSYSAGHSLGELTALSCAGVINFPDAIRIARIRGVLMQEISQINLGYMAAVNGISSDLVNDACRKFSTKGHMVNISNYNSYYQTVISGHKSALDKVCDTLVQSYKAIVIPLRVSAPFHSPIMKPVADELEIELRKCVFSDFKWPVISNVDALPYNSNKGITENLKMHVIKPVRWKESMEYIQRNGVNITIEIGPQTILSNLIKNSTSTIKTYSFDSLEDIKVICNENIKKKEMYSNNSFKYTVITKCISIAVCTKNLNYDDDVYQKGVLQPYKKLEKIQNEIYKENREPTLEEIEQALRLLHLIFKTKKVPAEEQGERFNEILEIARTKQLFVNFKFQ
jgi:[acyl-carrier-protein] S-malonyltransferase